jgi:hypothetical protein
VELAVTDRRRARRLAYADGWLPPRAAVVPGRRVIAVNLSEVGMLVEAAWYIRPSRLVEVRLHLAGRPTIVLAEVVRAYVSAIDRARGPRYRAAFDFATRIIVPSEPDLLQGALRILE